MNSFLRLLQDGYFHSGEKLGASEGISRSAVWKQLQRLEADLGLQVHKVRGRGYRLASALSLLDSSAIEDYAQRFGWTVVLHESLDSTNSLALRLLEARSASPLVVLAERQLSGRGRRGRSWVSPFAENIYFSLALRIEDGSRQLDALSLVVGLAVLQVARNSGVSAGLKWPNDILIQGKKLAGILVELVGDPEGMCHVVIGIGINVNMELAPENIGQPWTSFRAETGRLMDRTALVCALMSSLDQYLNRHRLEGFIGLQAEWEAGHLWQGQEVVLTSGARTVEGVVLGVDARGALRLRVAGVESQFNGGELSLRLRHDS
jgi:BirA family biotin operon repressor/biotin-[acetyl-CoA-carboxylase] ligase